MCLFGGFGLRNFILLHRSRPTPASLAPLVYAPLLNAWVMSRYVEPRRPLTRFARRPSRSGSSPSASPTQSPRCRTAKPWREIRSEQLVCYEHVHLGPSATRVAGAKSAMQYELDRGEPSEISRLVSFRTASPREQHSAVRRAETGRASPGRSRPVRRPRRR